MAWEFLGKIYFIYKIRPFCSEHIIKIWLIFSYIVFVKLCLNNMSTHEIILNVR